MREVKNLEKLADLHNVLEALADSLELAPSAYHDGEDLLTGRLTLNLHTAPRVRPETQHILVTAMELVMGSVHAIVCKELVAELRRQAAALHRAATDEFVAVVQEPINGGA